MTADILNPKSFVVPVVSSTSVKYAMVPQVGTLVFDSTLGKLSVAVAAVVGSAAWETVTSAAE